MDAFPPGQERVAAALANAVRTNRLAHGLLFTGAAGGGRERAALALAAGLLCAEPGRGSWGCGACRTCRRVVGGGHPDVHVLMPEAEAVRRGIAAADGKKRPSADILVDAVRDLVGRLRSAPYEGGVQLAIVVDAHRMNANAQNALLKTLEEPGPRTFLILVAPHETTLLPTIASRCLRLRFAPRPGDRVDNDVAGVLLRALLEGSARERLDAAEAAGKDRADVDAALAALQQVLATELRRDAAGEAGLSWRRAARLLESVAATREAIAQNGSVQLCLEQLLLAS